MHQFFSSLQKHASILRPFSTDTFARRHIGPTPSQTAYMLKTIGLSSLSDLIQATIPSAIRLPSPLDLPSPLTETQAISKLKAMSLENTVLKSFMGMGYSECITPAVIQRNLLENPGWYTAYTPYQAEVSQGRLESLLNFQTMISDLTGFEIANASLLDEGTAAAEAMALCHGSHSRKRNKFAVANDVHPQTLAVMQTRAAGIGIELVMVDVAKKGLDVIKEQLDEYSGVLVQYPNTYGSVMDWKETCAMIQSHGALMVVATDLLALTKLAPPGEWGADVAIGSAQRFGVPMMFGGPHAAFIATTEKHQRKLPGRIIGVSVDAEGHPALRMALQTREQHIRRDKATSNICTAQALLANMAANYAVYHGPKGLLDIANHVHLLTKTFVAGITSLTDCTVESLDYFDTVTVHLPNGVTAMQVQEHAVSNGMNVRIVDETRIGVSFGENSCQEDVVRLLSAFGVSPVAIDLSTLTEIGQSTNSIPESMVRTSSFLTHPVFNSHHSETKMLRYLKMLEDKDLSLNTSMIALGSCTMKLNATSELLPITWPEFSNMHPFVPRDQCIGYEKMISSLHAALAEITGFAAVSSQPNSGAQGEFAGLLCIKAYLASKNESHRNICLIPISAHGTNPASAVMAGMKVVVVKSDEDGNIDQDDLRKKVEKHKEHLAAFMITYPSTYGVFEEGVQEMCALIHEHGGQVYMDGANMNAQVALCNPGTIGADVCHLNLHKTFCIPHGGGGPGVGSIGVAEHLAPFLPGNPVIPCGGEGSSTDLKKDLAVNAAPYGSAGILPISWMYIHMLGEPGLRQATSHAILHANYMAAKMEGHYDVLFKGANGRVAHEFIIDIRPFKKVGIVEEDIAKRLQDFGFHSPTMSWPVGGTMMIEPTESEDLAEMDRLVEAFITIRSEIADIENKTILVDDSPLKHAPHTVGMVCGTEWNKKYTREQAAFPASWQKGSKGQTLKRFWPSVARVDNVHGDRNLICTCPPIESYQDEE